MTSIRRVATEDLRPEEVAAIRELLAETFGDEDGGFGELDWEHALGGVHVVLEDSATIFAHAAVVERTIEIDGRPFRTGYVEAVGTKVGHHGRGHGTAVMRVVGEIIRERFELGALGTGRFAFYERLGWERWRGPSSVRTPDGLLRTPDEDGWILVLRTPASGAIRLEAPISCDWRPGDVW